MFAARKIKLYCAVKGLLPRYNASALSYMWRYLYSLSWLKILSFLLLHNFVLVQAGMFGEIGLVCLQAMQLGGKQWKPSSGLAYLTGEVSWGLATENKRSSIWKLCCHRKLSSRQLTVPSLSTKLSSWRVFPLSKVSGSFETLTFGQPTCIRSHKWSK